MNNPELEQLPPEKVKFSWKRIGKIILVTVIVCVVLVAGYFLTNSRPVKVVFASLISDDHEHYLPCEQLPFLPEVQKELGQHQDVVEKIKQLGAFSVTAVEIKCPNYDGSVYFIKGDILNQYDTHSQRMAIEKLIGDNFFGIPWRGENH